MLQITPQERLALGVTALLIAAGAGVRLLGTDAEPAQWTAASGDSLATHALQAEAERQLERENLRNTPLAPGERIDPNRATADELQRLPRVGPTLAQRLIAHRESHGPFRTLDDLDAVPGVGPALLRTLGERLTLPPGSGATTTARPLDLNRATAAELEALPGVGPVLAERIIGWRTTHGRFRRVEDLEEIPGIGPKLRERLAPMVRVGSR